MTRRRTRCGCGALRGPVSCSVIMEWQDADGRVTAQLLVRCVDDEDLKTRHQEVQRILEQHLGVTPCCPEPRPPGAAEGHA